MENITNQNLTVKKAAVKKLTSLSEGLGKLQPQATDLEESILGALMLERDALSIVIDILIPDSFYSEQNKHIYEAILYLFNENKPIDIKTVIHQLRVFGKLEFVGGAYYVTQLTAKINSASNIEYHARIITEQYIKRKLIQISSGILDDAYEDTTDVFNLLEQAERSLFEITDSHIRGNFLDIKMLISKSLDEIQAKKDKKDGLTGIASGLSELDRVTSGWQNSDLIIIAARPGMGKTAFVVSILRNAAVDFNIPVALFSLEMSSVQLVNRMIAAESELENEKIKKGTLADYEWEQLIHTTSKLNNAPIFIDDTPALSLLEIRAKSRRLVAMNQVKIIVVDYLQLMSSDQGNKKANGNREQEIATISRALKSTAKELNIPIIALSQLNRSMEIRGGTKKPMLSDLRDSGSIEQDADIVMFLYRPEYYGFDVDEAGQPTRGLAELIIAKHRNGNTGSINLKFIPKFTKFTDWTEMTDPTASQSFPHDPKKNNNEVLIKQSRKTDHPNAPEDIVPF